MSLGTFGINFRVSYPYDASIVQSRSNEELATTKKYIFRSGCCSTFSQEDIKKLYTKFGIKNWFDLNLRDINNKLEVNELFNLHSIKYYSYQLILEEDKILPDRPNVSDYLKYYQFLLVNSSDNLRELFYMMESALSNGNIGISCYAGKDRTGVVCYLIHLILNSHAEDVRNDFIKSENCIVQHAGFFIKNAEKKNLTIEEYTKRFLLCSKVYDAFDNWFREKYENINCFLKEIGLSEEFREKFKRHFY